MAADRLRAVRAIRPNGPYALGGHCNGALVAIEMARLLVEEGTDVPVVIVLDAKAPWRSVRMFPGVSMGEERAKSPRETGTPDATDALPPDTTLLYRRAIARYVPRHYPGRLVVLRSQANRDLRDSLGWAGMASIIETYVIPGDHHTSITRHVAETGARIKSCLDAALAESPVPAQARTR